MRDIFGFEDSMRTKKVDIKNKTLMVVGPLYNKLDKLSALENLLDDSKVLVFLGDTCFPYEKHSDIAPRIDKIKSFMESKDAHYILGDKDLIYMEKTFNSTNYNSWLSFQHTAIRFMFDNQVSVMVLHGGILPQHTTWDEVSGDLEIAFISNFKQINKPWHTSYNGRFGYILSSHPANKNKDIEKYTHSISLDTDAYETDKVAVQEYSKNGLGKTHWI